MRYFEVIFDNGTNEVETMGSICIVGSETPTKEELEGDIIFRQDMKLFNSDHIYAIDELSKTKYTFSMSKNAKASSFESSSIA